MNLAKILKDRRDAERRLEQTSPKPVFNGGAADSVEGGGGEIISDGVTLAQLTTGLAGKSESDHVHEFVDLTDTPSSYTDAGGKLVAVNSGATALEFIAAPAAANGVPAGGTTNQLAAKNSNTDYDLKWVDAPSAANGIPTGGSTEQILSKIDGTDYNAHWVDKPSGGSSPLTTKGDVFVYGSADARLPVGTNGQVLTVDSAQTLGVKWAAAGGALDANSVLAIPFGTPPTSPTADTVLLFADYIESTDNEIPQMTSDTAPSGVCSASSTHSSLATWWAFDNTGAKYGWGSNMTTTGWLQYQFDSAVTISAYSIRAWWVDEYPSRNPKNWTFKGSNNGTDWTTLDTQTGWSSTNSTSYTKFECATTGSYTYYRLDVTANNGGSLVGVGGLKMFAYSDTVSLKLMDSAGAIHRIT